MMMIEKLGCFTGEVSPADLRIAEKLNEVIDAVNELQEQVAEHDQEIDDCARDINKKETFVSIDEALKMGKQDHKIRSTNKRLRKALEIAVDALRHTNWFFDGDYNICAKDMNKEIRFAIEAINEITKGGKDE